MKLLVCGAGGQVGSEFSALATEQITISSKNSTELNINDPAAIKKAIEAFSPDCIINAAAYTAVDKAENEPRQAYAVNCEGVTNLALACKAANIPLLHISTDYVFDGIKTVPYLESDKPSPQGVYGASKLAGEHSLELSWHKHIILRVSWVFGAQGNNFVKTMLRLAKERNELSIVSDQLGAPTSAASIAKNLVNIAKQLITSDEPDALYGIYHLPSLPYTNWCAFAEQIINRGQALGLLEKQPLITAINTEQYPTPAARPANSRLSSERNSLNIETCDWQQELENVLNDIKSKQA